MIPPNSSDQAGSHTQEEDEEPAKGQSQRAQAASEEALVADILNVDLGLVLPKRQRQPMQSLFGDLLQLWSLNSVRRKDLVDHCKWRFAGATSPLASRFGLPKRISWPQVAIMQLHDGLPPACAWHGADWEPLPARPVGPRWIAMSYCRSCAAIGFHSPIQDLCWITHCPWHSEPLKKLCESCASKWRAAVPSVRERACELCQFAMPDPVAVAARGPLPAQGHALAERYLEFKDRLREREDIWRQAWAPVFFRRRDFEDDLPPLKYPIPECTDSAEQNVRSMGQLALVLGYADVAKALMDVAALRRKTFVVPGRFASPHAPPESLGVPEAKQVFDTELRESVEAAKKSLVQLVERTVKQFRNCHAATCGPHDAPRFDNCSFCRGYRHWRVAMELVGNPRRSSCRIENIESQIPLPRRIACAPSPQRSGVTKWLFLEDSKRLLVDLILMYHEPRVRVHNHWKSDPYEPHRFMIAAPDGDDLRFTIWDTVELSSIIRASMELSPCREIQPEHQPSRNRLDFVRSGIGVIMYR